MEMSPENTSPAALQASQIRHGCAQIAAIAAALFWLGAAPALSMGLGALVSDAVTGDSLPALVAPLIALIAAGILLLPPLALGLLLTRRRSGWAPTAATLMATLTVAGYVLISGLCTLLLSAHPNWQAALRLGLLAPYTLLAIWAAPRLLGLPAERLRAQLGFKRAESGAFGLALAVAALLTLPWPLTGALGDRWTSLGLTLQALAQELPAALLLWGAAFALLQRAYRSGWLAALTTTALYALLVAGGVLANGDWGALANALFLLPLALLLTELRAHGQSLWPVLPVLLLCRLTPRLFVDPRDMQAQGIPELQHVLSHAIVWWTTVLAGPLLWGARKMLAHLLPADDAAKSRTRATLRRVWGYLAPAAAIGLWLLWGGLYIGLGKPGFYDDGFLIIMEEQAELDFAAAIPEREARIQAVYDALTETAARTQSPIRAELEQRKLPYRPYYIINMLRVEGHTGQMRRFAALPGVAAVIRNPNVREYPNRIPFPMTGDTYPVDDLQDNLAAIAVDEAWALGVAGAGIVVAGQDTGYDWEHPALKIHYRGWDGANAQHDFNWHDSWDNTPVPFDGDEHGTHTMGTILGDDGSANRTGVAPAAQWIGCRNMRRGVGNPASYIECMEFFLAPYPIAGDPFTEGNVRMSPHVINNSWGCPTQEGCFSDTLEPALAALRAAGIMMVVSAGNDGPACSTALTPPANSDAAYSVGATYNNGWATGFSSRGPVNGRLKPDIAAPGSSVRSSVPGGGYGYADGTSMAGPHVAGLVALLWSANPALIGDIEATEALICRTATPRPVETTCSIEAANASGLTGLVEEPVCACGDVTGTPNNVYGCGSINAGAAVREALDRP